MDVKSLEERTASQYSATNWFGIKKFEKNVKDFNLLDYCLNLRTKRALKDR